MKVVILGKGEMLANLIEGVKESNSDIIGVFRYERTIINPIKLFINDFFKNSPELTLIKKYKLHEIKCKSANSDEFKKEILKLNADVILVGTWREKLKKEIFDMPTLATINVHPSLLPNYRGPNPYIQTILHGEKQSGVTFHLINEEFDKGAILAQQKIDILPFDTSKELKEKTVFQARLLVCELLKKLNQGLIIPQEQSKGSYYPNISGNEKMLDFKTQTSTEIINTVRALHPFLPTYITIGNHFLIVNPYKVKITNKKGSANQIITKHIKTRTLIIAGKDGIGVKFSDLKLYRFPIFTKFFMTRMK